MKKYMSYCSQYLCTGNKLEDSFKKFIMQNDRKLIDENDLDNFKEHLQRGVSKLNAEHKRCKPIKISFWEPTAFYSDFDRDTIMNDSSHTVRFSLMACIPTKVILS